MSQYESFSFIRRLSQLGTLLQTFLYGKEVGRDIFGNRYFQDRNSSASGGRGLQQKRWVLYAGEPEASKVPPEWHIWLHHITDAPLGDNTRRVWQKPHIENMTGTPQAWLPPTLEGNARPKATGDYEAWKP